VHRHFGQIPRWSCALLLSASLPAQAVDLVPFAGFRFGGTVTTTNTAINPPTTASFSLDGALSYGAAIDLPFSGGRAVELYYSHEPTTISGVSPALQPVHDVSVNVLHLGFVDSIPAEEPQVSWLLIGSFGATQLQAGGITETRPSIGLGGGAVWMPNEHVGLRADLRALITFTGNSAGSVACSGGCTIAFHSTAAVQGEISVGLVARF